MGAIIGDIGPQVISLPSLFTAGQVSGLWAGLSGGQIGTSVDLINANGYCNVWVQGTGALLSGRVRFQVQQSDQDVSGTYTDPTIGILSGDLTNVFTSGCIMTLNPNNSGGVFSGFTSGQAFLSGFLAFGGFMRGARFVRLNIVSGDQAVMDLSAGFISQAKMTNPTGGFSFQPTSGQVSV